MNLIDRNRDIMTKFETMINTADDNLASELIASEAAFYTPASKTPLYGGEGYLSVVHWMRKGFSNIKWTVQDMVIESDKVAVFWKMTGTHDGEFLGFSPTNKKIDVSVMNFYYFNSDGKIINDVAAEGMIGIFRAIGAKI